MRNEALIRDLQALGLKERDVVLVHSALRPLGFVEGGVHTVIDSLQALLSPEGTLLFPALSYDFVPPSDPRFDLASTPCCVGKIPEAFRTRPQVLRSLHPTHSVCAWGKYASEITADHQKDDTPVGEHSPFRKLPAYKGKILMLGCKLYSLTFMHGVEEIARSPYALTPEKHPFHITDAHGNTQTVFQYRHDFGGERIRQRYDRIEALLPPEACRHGKVLEGMAWLLDAAAVQRAALAAMERDPYFFVDLPPA